MVPVSRRCGIGVVVVMPPFSSGEEADDRVVAAVVRCFVVPVAPNMGHRIDGPSGSTMTSGTVSKELSNGTRRGGATNAKARSGCSAVS